MGAAARAHTTPLRIRQLSKRFGSVVALAEVSLDVERGEIVGLVGPNGSGKTTLLLVTAGLLPHDDGSVGVCGFVAGTLAARRSLGLAPDEPGGLDELTVGEHVGLVLALHQAGARAHRRARALAEAFGIDARWHERLGALSRGLRRQAAYVACLALDVPLVVVDEATATLDPEAVVVLHESLRARAREGAGVLLATQDLHFAERVCDTVVILHRGRIAARGAPDELVDARHVMTLEDAFLAEAGIAGLRERVRGELAAL